MTTTERPEIGQNAVANGIRTNYLEDGKASDPAPVKEGRYEARVTAGMKRVRIRAAQIKEGGARDAMGLPVPEDYLPARYNTETTLRADVVAGGPNVFDFPLEEK